MVAKICSLGHIYQGSRCPQCPAPKKDPTEFARRIRSTVRWHRAKERVLNRDSHRCTYGTYDEDDKRGLFAGDQCLAKKKLDVHHRIPIEDGGEPYADDNLRTLCTRHHAVVESNYRRRRDGETEAAATQKEIVEPE